MFKGHRRKKKHEKEQALLRDDESPLLAEPSSSTATMTTTNNNNYQQRNIITVETTTPTHHADHYNEDDMPAIYAAPTVDTLDDESLVLGCRTTSMATYQRRLREDDEQSGVMRHHVSFTPLSVDTSNQNKSTGSFKSSTTGSDYSYHHRAYSPTKKKTQKSHHSNNIPEEEAEEGEEDVSALLVRAAIHKRKKKQQQQQPRGDFQQKEDAMTVAIVPVNVQQRAAFEPSKPVSIEEWHRVALQLEQKSSGSSKQAFPGNLSNAHKKLSPSLQHLKLLHHMQSTTQIRQLAFSPSVGIDSDVFVPWWAEALAYHDTAKKDNATTPSTNTSTDNIDNTEKAPKLKRRLSSQAAAAELRDGRYRSIHPVQATVSALPPVPPALSNRKTRLPLRSDVGFPGASEDEIRQKQAEINHETEWEQASPRIIVLVTSDDLGTAVQEDRRSGGNSSTEPKNCSTGDHWEWNGGGLEGMPWAGRDLLRAKEMNALHFSKKSSILASSSTTTSKEQGVLNSNKKRLLEPNRTSVLAPPLDASYSRTLGWRPRPFHDRTPGMEYLLCWPMNVSFHVGDVEPLLCSLSLYNLPTNNNNNNSTSNAGNGVYGKISEDFFFPAGNWEGKMNVDASYFDFPNAAGGDNKTGQSPEELMQAWANKKQKAIFSYDPLVICGDKTCLFWVLQIFKVADEELACAYLSNNNGAANENSPNPHKRSNSVTRLFKSSKSNGHSKHRNGTTETANNGSEQYSANKNFDKFGAKFMTQLAFGVSSVVQKPSTTTDEGSTSMEFPMGKVHHTQLMAAPSVPESQEDFVLRLSRITTSDTSHGVSGEQWIRPVGEADRSTELSQLQSEFSEGSLATDLASIASDHSDPTSSTHPRKSRADKCSSRCNPIKGKSASPTPKKKNLTKRIWMTPVKVTRSLASSSPKLVPTTTTDRVETPLAGTAGVFTSVLSTDWLQSMLKEPTDMDGFRLLRHPPSAASTDIPKVLCDVSGDFAVMLESGGSSNKRSSLSRLPCHPKPAGYAAGSEIREVLFLPARPEKTYDIDIPPPFRSLVNLLYLYPRLLRYSPDNGNKPKKQSSRSRFSVRTRLVQTAMEVDHNGKISSSTTALGAFHSPTPWTGSPLLEEVYTHVPRHISHKQKKNEGQGAKGEQAMRDEFKLRLPHILDGSYFLQFTLFEIEPEECDGKEEVKVRAVADNSIPLSSSTVRDAAGNQRVATVIPNGCHRIRLGDFKFYIESRLISSIHIGDAAVAAAVRDFPATEMGNPQKLLQEPEVIYPTLFANASDGTLVGHFQLLLYVHLSNLVSGTQDSLIQNASTKSERSSLMIGNLVSLFQIVRKVKNRLNPAEKSSTGGKRLAAFMKKAIDEYEEKSLALSVGSGHGVYDEQASDAGSEDILELREANTESGASQSAGIESDEEDEILDEGAVRVRHKDSLRSGIERRLTRRASVGTDMTASLSRVAYGASKTDRLKIEAELYYNGGRFDHLFDDDETIVTSGTYLHALPDTKLKPATSVRGQHGRKLWAIEQNTSLDDLYTESSIKAATAAASRAINVKAKKDSASSKSEEGFATRVKTVANVMLAPCGVGVGKSTSPRRISLDCGRASRRRRTSTGRSPTNAVETSKGVPSHEAAKEIERRDVFVFPGSDDEGEDDEIEQSRLKKSRYSKFRRFQGQKPWAFDLDQATGGKYVYETLVALWIQAWSDHDKNEDSQNFLLGFSENFDLFLPLCLKSVALRLHDSPDRGWAILDEKHVVFLEEFSVVLAKSMMLTYAKTAGRDTQDKALLQALVSSERVLDFFEGLFAIVHPEHMRCFIEAYMKALRECENEHIKENSDGMFEFDWTPHSIHRIRMSRQLRLRAVERLAVMPSFLAANFPLKYSEHHPSTSTFVDNEGDSTWKIQYSDSNVDAPKSHPNKDATMRRSADGKSPESGWLALLLANEAFSVCALSCEAVVAEAMAHIESVQTKSNAKSEGPQRKGQLDRGDILMFQSLAIHAITVAYELLLRRHAMDVRFQTNTCRGRIAALYTECLFRMSLQSVRWLARMESTHKVRSIWMLCLVYLLQEAPEVLIRDLVRTYCDPSDILIHRFIRLLRLSSSTFQSFVDQPRHSTFPNEIDEGISPWLLQESFNTISATTNIVVEECVKLTESNPKEQRKMIHSILDLFLHILTTPQSAVTHLRALGGALQSLEKFGINIFLQVVDDSLQHWIRVILGLMNSTSLSVRSISVDFVLSLLGSAFDLSGNIDGILLVFVSVLPEVVAREIGLFSVDGLVRTFEDLERSIWPLRRSFGELEDANPLDDDRIDPELSQIMKSFCRASQAVLDSVLIELRLRKDRCVVVGTKVKVTPKDTCTFDADEESVWEAASFFVPETGPMQRIRWLLTLKALHESKGQWLEAAETMIACANTISDAIPHLSQIWRPSRFLLWSDSRRSTWLSTVGEDMGHPDRGNAAVVSFSDEFLEPRSILGVTYARPKSGKLEQPTFSAMCTMLTAVAKEAVKFYLMEDGMDEIAYVRLEKLLTTVVNVLGEHGSLDSRYGRSIRTMSISARKRHVEEEAALRRVSIGLSGDMTKLAERLLLVIQDEPGSPDREGKEQPRINLHDEAMKGPFYVLVSISGIKPPRFQESTTLPTFLDWNTPCVVRVSQQLVNSARKRCKDDIRKLTRQICLEVGESLKRAIVCEIPSQSVNLRLDPDDNYKETSGKENSPTTFIDITLLHTDIESTSLLMGSCSGVRDTKRFVYTKSDPLLMLQDKSVVASPDTGGKATTLVEVTVANTFPSVLSRQRALLTSEFVSNTVT